MDTRVKAVLLVICAGIFGTTDGLTADDYQLIESRLDELERHLDSEIHDHHAVLFSASRLDNATDVAMGSCVVYNLAPLNRGDAYDLKTGVFTCPTAGVYLFSYSSQQGPHTGNTLLSLRMNDIGVSQLLTQLNLSESLGSERSLLLYLNVGDRMCVTLDDGELHGGPFSMTFQGYRVSD